MKKINKLELTEIVSEEAHLTKKDAKAAVDIVFESVKKCIIENQTVNISGFGSFVPIKKSGRKGTDPLTHKEIKIKSKRSVSLRLSRSFKEELN